MIRSDVRFLLVSNEVRRHRLISISCILLVPCHGLPTHDRSGIRCFLAEHIFGMLSVSCIREGLLNSY